MACNILLQTGGKIVLESGAGYLLLNNCVVPDVEGGGLPQDNYYQPYIRRDKQEAAQDIVRAETSLIDLRQRAQEARLREIALRQSNDLADEQELARALSAQIYLTKQIAIEARRLLVLRNNLALIVLSAANPFLRIGGVKTIM